MSSLTQSSTTAQNYSETELPPQSNVTVDKGHSTKPPSFLFDKFGIIGLLIILVVSALLRQMAVVILLGLVLCTIGITRFWSWTSLKGVSCQRLLSSERVFPGEQTELKLRLVNRKPLPLAWVQIDDQIPEGITTANTASSGYSNKGTLTNTASLLWYSAINWRYPLICRKRGYYTLGPLSVTSGDIFGFYPRSAVQPAASHIIVYPRIYPLGQSRIPSLSPIGETKAERRIFEDSSRPIGVRDYTPSDSLKYVHWKASARHQTLQVKLFEATTTLKVALFLVADNLAYGQGYEEDTFELAVSTAASLANHVIEQRSAAGLFANLQLCDSGQPIRIHPGSTSSHLVNIFEALAKIKPASTGPFTDFFQTERSHLPWGATLFFILKQPGEWLAPLVSDLNRTGYKPVVLQIGPPDGSSIPGITWYNVAQPGDLMELGLRSTR